MHAAGVPAGVFNLVNGDGAGCRRGHRQPSGHRHGLVHRLDPRRRRGGQGAAPTVKRVAQELGGKSPNIILEDAEIANSVRGGVVSMMLQLRPVLQCADPHAGAARADGRGHRHRHGSRRAGHRRRPQRQRARSARWVKDPVGQDPAPDQGRHRRGRDSGHRRPRPSGRPGQGLLCEAHRLRQRHQRHDHRPRRDLRAGAVASSATTTSIRRSRSATTPNTASPAMSRERPRQGARRGPQDPRRPGVDQSSAAATRTRPSAATR